MIAVALLFIGVVILGMKKSRLTLRGVAMGFFSWLVSLVGAGLVSTFGWGALEDSSFVNPLPHGIAYNSSLYASAFLALTIAIAAAVYALVHGRAGHENLTAGALLWWLVALIVASLLFPGARRGLSGSRSVVPWCSQPRSANICVGRLSFPDLTPFAKSESGGRRATDFRDGTLVPSNRDRAGDLFSSSHCCVLA